jgi:hypothetical protein
VHETKGAKRGSAQHRDNSAHKTWPDASMLNIEAG